MNCASEFGVMLKYIDKDEGQLVLDKCEEIDKLHQELVKIKHNANDNAKDKLTIEKLTTKIAKIAAFVQETTCTHVKRHVYSQLLLHLRRVLMKTRPTESQFFRKKWKLLWRYTRYVEYVSL